MERPKPNKELIEYIKNNPTERVIKIAFKFDVSPQWVYKLKKKYEI